MSIFTPALNRAVYCCLFLVTLQLSLGWRAKKTIICQAFGQANDFRLHGADLLENRGNFNFKKHETMELSLTGDTTHETEYDQMPSI